LKVQVDIKDVESGEVRTYLTEYDSSISDETIAFLWGGHNFACDCNRQIALLEAGGMSNDEAYDEDRECGTTALEVLVIREDGGRVICDCDPR
jgi:hypothetical protein